MAILEKAIDYVVGIVTENEEVKKFPKDFVTASMQWIRTWFLIDDPKTEAKLTDPKRSEESKKTLVESKLEDLNENPQFVKELTERLAAFEQQRARIKNVVTDSDIKVDGSVHIGDQGNSSGDNYDEKNIIKGSTITAGGDFRVGDDVITGNQNVQIVHNYLGGNKKQVKAAAGTDIKSELKALLAKEKAGEVIERLLDLTEGQDDSLNNSVLLTSARLNRINKKEHDGVISSSDANVERNKINSALTSFVDDLEV
ncbi:MAG: hypothetical protein ACRBG0_15175 [Lewinella sp.]|uniref:hypothetical protein n=1 Tax=Lewinella sp. TaxID=2004506 RepID=UPI003D6C39A3